MGKDKIILSFLIFTLNSNFTFGQSDNINCDSIWNNFNGNAEPTELILLYEQAPRLIGGYDQLKRKVHNDHLKGKVYLQFVVDTMGKTRCIRILKTDNKELNDRAIKLVEEMKFTPAEKRNKPIVSTMALPITFGDVTPNKEKKCNN